MAKRDFEPNIQRELEPSTVAAALRERHGPQTPMNALLEDGVSHNWPVDRTLEVVG